VLWLVQLANVCALCVAFISQLLKTFLSLPAFLIFILAYLPVFNHICSMEDFDWNEQAKRLLKSELVRRGISNDDLVSRLQAIGVEETKASVESKISRGTFSAAFLLQCLNAIGCKNFVPEVETLELVVTEPRTVYKAKSKSKKSAR
jgi:hypothetical protein